MDWLSAHQWSAWLGIAIALVVGEMLSLDLIMAMLALGALAGMVAALAGGSVVVQVLVAAVAGLATIALVRPALVKRLHNGPDLKQGAEWLVGEQGVVLVEATALHPGRVKVRGEEWTAAPSEPQATLPVGATVEVRSIRGATAYVSLTTVPEA